MHNKGIRKAKALEQALRQQGLRPAEVAQWLYVGREK